MKTTVSLHDFREAFRTASRTDNFSYEGLELLFEHLEQYEEDAGEELELDVVALCCDYYEQDAAGIADDYDLELPDDADEEETAEAIAEQLADMTSVVGTTSANTIIYAAF